MAHEAAHVVQQRTVHSDSGADYIQRDCDPAREVCPAKGEAQGGGETAEISSRDRDLAESLENLPQFLATGIIETEGGLRSLERSLPTTYGIIRQRLIDRYGERTFDGLYLGGSIGVGPR